jgi:hypothetical protein
MHGNVKPLRGILQKGATWILQNLIAFGKCRVITMSQNVIGHKEFSSDDKIIYNELDNNAFSVADKVL